jgi:glycosyltransferase involved in cell wall biosynthesis
MLKLLQYKRYNKYKIKIERKDMTICLSMIVKNEAHIIETTLENICTHIPLSYWVISDTGSTDNTKELITSFFEKKQIKGELVEHEWKDFAHNRTKALECAYQKTDYVFIFDADDSIHGELKLPPLKDDRYMFQFGQGFSYLRPLLITNRKPWFYTGVLHEFLDCSEPRGATMLKGKYHIESGRQGARSKNPNKYLDDANVLKKAFVDEPRMDLKTRYAFYCGQSYMDALQNDDAIEWYLKTLELHGWDQEKYYSCLQLGGLYERKNDFMKMQHYWCKSIQYDTERIEGIVLTAMYLYQQGNHVMVNALYHKFKNYSRNLKDKLFIRNYLYEYELEYLNSISAYYARDPLSGYECCKRIILNHTDKGKVDQCIKNLLFYKPLLHKDKKMVALLKQKGVPELFFK